MTIPLINDGSNIKVTKLPHSLIPFIFTAVDDCIILNSGSKDFSEQLHGKVLFQTASQKQKKFIPKTLLKAAGQY